MTAVAYDFSGRAVLVVGASRGIGAGTAQAFARAGASVVVASRNQDAVDGVAAGIVDDGGTAVGLACDAAAGEQAQRATAASVPMGRIGAVEDVAQVVLWLASDGARFVTGATVPVDGGRAAGVKPPQMVRPDTPVAP